jgi:hypothetical protein
MAQIRVGNQTIDQVYIANAADISGGGGSGTQPAAAFASGTLSGTSLVRPLAGAPLPCTITLVSSAGTREIALSTDGGNTYFVPTRQDGNPAYDANTPTMINIVITGSATNVRFTGIAGNAWSIL